MMFEKYLQQEVRFLDPVPQSFIAGEGHPNALLRLVHGHFFNALGNFFLKPFHMLMGRPRRVVHGCSMEAEVRLDFPSQLLWSREPLSSELAESFPVHFFPTQQAQAYFIGQMNRMGYHSSLVHGGDDIEVSSLFPSKDSLEVINQAFFEALFEPRDHGAILSLPKKIVKGHFDLTAWLPEITRRLGVGKVTQEEGTSDAGPRILLKLEAKANSLDRKFVAKQLVKIWHRARIYDTLIHCFPPSSDSSTQRWRPRWSLGGTHSRICRITLETEDGFNQLLSSLNRQKFLKGHTVQISSRKVHYGHKQEIVPPTENTSFLQKLGKWALFFVTLPFLVLGFFSKLAAWPAIRRHMVSRPLNSSAMTPGAPKEDIPTCAQCPKPKAARVELINSSSSDENWEAAQQTFIVKRRRCLRKRRPRKPNHESQESSSAPISDDSSQDSDIELPREPIAQAGHRRRYSRKTNP